MTITHVYDEFALLDADLQVSAVYVDGATGATTAARLKAEGQAIAAENITSVCQLVFFSAVASRRPGQIITANTLRDVLDAAEVPLGARAPLFRMACTEGILEPYMVDVDGQRVHVGVPSTGESARGAYVKAYRRTGKVWTPGLLEAVA